MENVYVNFQIPVQDGLVSEILRLDFSPDSPNYKIKVLIAAIDREGWKGFMCHG